MLRQELLVPDGLWSQEELGRRVGVEPGQSLYVLVNRGAGGGFVLLLPGVMLDGQERVVIYAFDPRSDEDLVAVNATSAGHYVAWGAGPWPDEVAVIEQLVPERGAEVLEICCGAGRTAPALVRQGNRVTAIDWSQECIRAAAAADRAGVHYQVADATSLPFGERSFELACCFENSLLVRREEMVAELVRVSRKLVVLGLREMPEVGAGQLQVSGFPNGLIEVTRLHNPASVERMLAALPAAAAARLGRRRWLGGAPRPWGGREFFVVLDLLG